VQRHVLRLKRGHPITSRGENPPQARGENRFSHVRSRSQDHQSILSSYHFASLFTLSNPGPREMWRCLIALSSWYVVKPRAVLTQGAARYSHLIKSPSFTRYRSA